jgi:hypothetical protein
LLNIIVARLAASPVCEKFRWSEFIPKWAVAARLWNSVLIAITVTILMKQKCNSHAGKGTEVLRTYF